MQEDKKEMLSSLLGKDGQEALQMMQRMERLQRLMGPRNPLPPVKKEESDLLARSRREDMISAAIPFLDREYQKGIYVAMRLMEMQRVLQGDLLEVREKQQPAPERRRALLGAIGPFLQEEDRTRMETLLKMMDVKRIMEGMEKI